MTPPIINPTTLTEKQREAIRVEYEKATELYKKWHDESERSAIDTLERLFGKDFFKFKRRMI